jgi:hypothetical protein
VSSRAAISRLAAAVAFATCVLALSLWAPAVASAASPVPTPDAGGDTRSAGEGPGLIGAPIVAIGGVLVLGIASAGLTLVYIRATEARRPGRTAAGPGADRSPDEPDRGPR